MISDPNHSTSCLSLVVDTNLGNTLTLAVTLGGDPDLVRSSLWSPSPPLPPPPSGGARSVREARGVVELGEEEVGVVGNRDEVEAGGGKRGLRRA